MFFPGLTSKPFHQAESFSFTKDFEANITSIQKEYRALKEAYGQEDDYAK